MKTDKFRRNVQLVWGYFIQYDNKKTASPFGEKPPDHLFICLWDSVPRLVSFCKSFTETFLVFALSFCALCTLSAATELYTLKHV